MVFLKEAGWSISREAEKRSLRCKRFRPLGRFTTPSSASRPMTSPPLEGGELFVDSRYSFSRRGCRPPQNRRGEEKNTTPSAEAAATPPQSRRGVLKSKIRNGKFLLLNNEGDFLPPSSRDNLHISSRCACHVSRSSFADRLQVYQIRPNSDRFSTGANQISRGLPVHAAGWDEPNVR